MEQITLTIDGVQVQVEPGATVLEAARKAHVHIPTLCYLKGWNEVGACRICCVDVGGRALQAACVLPATEGMAVRTNTPAVREARKLNLQLLLSNHDRRCLSCVRNRRCELQKLCDELGVDQEELFEGHKTDLPLQEASPAIVRDPNKCILCRRCVAACADVQKIGVIGAVGRGFDTAVAPAWDKELAEVACVYCGQCVISCPVGALSEKSGIDEVWSLLADPDKTVIVQTAPAVRAALGEEFGMPIGTRVTGKMAAALRRLGFARVFDTDFAADLTIMEEGTEFIDRFQNGGTLPMITSCSPGWVKYCEHYYPDFLPNLSTCKSPHEMLGAIAKSYYAEHRKIDPAKMRVVSVMPCVAKKFEAQRPELSAKGNQDVDVVITTRELARMIKQAGIDFASLPDEDFDAMLGESTGAGVIFGATGGVMEASLRTVVELMTGKPLERVEFCAVRGLEGVKEATLKLGDAQVNIAVAHGTGNAAKLLDSIRAGEKNYHFIEIMGCPGGCVTGGGQPHVDAGTLMDANPGALRAAALYAEDEGKVLRKSHENPAIQQLYKDFLGEPNGHKAHDLLHTGYTKRPMYTE
ncbi:MAG: NADH-dependent [FeFe] hydrogenase, group A6 [Clostridia bacterium]|nr:NADH-dependent [FeFe] hydrogenase, group A6 [Clostridia bacterium]